MAHSDRSAMSEAQLARACQRALVAGARAEGAGTRQQLRAAARGFVRRHRRDLSYLRWVLRSVAASSALAVALLGLGASPARAAGTLFTEQTGVANPLDGADVGSYSTPSLGDLDGDGDPDLVAGGLDGNFRYFQNTGSATSPVFSAAVTNPFGLADVGYVSAPALGDLDGDGDLDLVSGEGFFGGFRYFQNTGSATSPAFAAAVTNPFGLASLGGLDRSSPALADLDGDGDLDLLVGRVDGTFLYFQNTGSATSPAFAAAVTNPFGLADVGSYSAPLLADLDGDGDLDLLSGEYFDFFYFENTGGATSPTFAAAVTNPFGLATTATGILALSLGDVDGDGDLDLVSGEYYGTFLSFENRAGEFVALTGAANPLDGDDVGDQSTPSLGDLDGDGDLDLVAGDEDGNFHYFENTGSATSPAFAAAVTNPFGLTDVGVYSTPALGDVDGDGDLDLVVGEILGTFQYFENTGSATSPAFAGAVANPFGLADVGDFSAPSLGDVDGDGDLDFVAGADYGNFLYFENTGSAVSPAFAAAVTNPFGLADVGDFSIPSLGDLDGDGDLDLVAGEYDGGFDTFVNAVVRPTPSSLELTGADNPLDGEDVGEASTPSLGDLDGDGDLDLVAGEYYGDFFHFQNTGSATSPAFAAAVTNPFGLANVGSYSAPSLGDLDGDGDLDLVAGESAGGFFYFENTGSATSPAFATAVTNPFGLADVGRDSTPSLGDLDRDGDLDLVAGEGAGGFFYFENTGSATSPAFAAAVTNPFGLAGVGYDSTPALGDVDRDGDLDLVSGEYGDFFYFENTGSATSPAFAAALTNPFDLAPVGTDLALSLGDVDGDGDLDLVAGEYDGVFRPYLLPEPDQGLMLGAGISFLKLLERLRRRGERRSPPPPPG